MKATQFLAYSLLFICLLIFSNLYAELRLANQCQEYSRYGYDFVRTKNTHFYYNPVYANRVDSIYIVDNSYGVEPKTWYCDYNETAYGDSIIYCSIYYDALGDTTASEILTRDAQDRIIGVVMNQPDNSNVFNARFYYGAYSQPDSIKIFDSVAYDEKRIILYDNQGRKLSQHWYYTRDGISWICSGYFNYTYLVPMPIELNLDTLIKEQRNYNFFIFDKYWLFNAITYYDLPYATWDPPVTCTCSHQIQNGILFEITWASTLYDDIYTEDYHFNTYGYPDSVIAIEYWWNPSTMRTQKKTFYTWEEATPITDPMLPPSQLKMSSKPNPFYSTTNINFELKTKSEVVLSIYNLKGQRVRSLYRGTFPKGPNEIRWDGKSNKGTYVTRGIYLARLQGAGISNTIKMLKLN